MAPCGPKKSLILSTDQDNQPAVVQVFEGTGPMTKDNHLLGNITFEETLQHLVTASD